MAGSSTSSGRARLMREMSRDLSASRLSIPSPTKSLHDSEPAPPTLSSLDSQNEGLLQSTQQLDVTDTHKLPEIRTTAKKFGYYHPAEPEYHVNTSALDAFQDFTAASPSEEDSMSIEIGRGVKKSGNVRSTPNRHDRDMSPNVLLSVEDNSLYEVTGTPPVRPRPTARKSDGFERGNLRRDAQIRRASSLGQKEIDALLARSSKADERVSPGKGASQRRRTTLVQMHTRMSEEEAELALERPPTVTITAKTTRFGNPRSRQTSAALNSTSGTPQRAAAATPANATAQSFMLPDLPNLTELVSGVYKDGTPVFSRSAKARSRFVSDPYPRRNGRGQPSYSALESIPVPADEKAILASLQLLKEKVAQLEQEKAESDKKIEDYENEVADLKAELSAQENMRRSDSALGASDAESGREKTNWRIEKMRLESSVHSLQTRLDRAERKVSVSEIATKRATQERDNLVTQLSTAFYTTEELKAEKEALQSENEHLRNEVDELRSENEALRAELVQNAAYFEDETQQLQKRMERKDHGFQKENETLRAELARAHAQHDDETQQLARKELEARRQKAEYNKLKSENDRLKSQLAEAKAQREEEARRAKTQQAEFQGRLDQRDDTIRQFRDMPQEDVNSTLRQENEGLRVQLAQLTVHHDDETQQWGQRSHSYERAAPTETGGDEAIKETEIVKPKVQKRTGGRVGQDTQARIFDKIDLEVRNSQSVSGPKPSRIEPPAQPRRQSRSKSRDNARQPSVPRQANVSRRDPVPASLAEPVVSQDLSDAESTTDLEIRPRSTLRTAREADNVTNDRLADETSAADLTYLSSINRDELAKIRRVLEEERLATRRKATQTRQNQNDTVRSSAPLPRKSSLKDMTSRSIPADEHIQQSAPADHDSNAESDIDSQPSSDDEDASAPQPRQNTSNSILSHSARRPRSAPELTSAFILPDITLHQRKISVPAHHDAQHDRKNCTVCHRSDSASTQPISIPTPIPVSDRMPDDVDATMRPAQPPALALATVIKELQDELDHIKIQIATWETYLQDLDPSLGLRKRKTVQEQLDALLKAHDVRADQIYALHDVLEGQKAAAAAAAGEAGGVGGADEVMGEKEVEETLMSVGIDPEEARERMGRARGKKVTIRSHVSEEESDEEELPWEGISESGSLRGL
ncbi:hypothetical protein H2199_006000 [Coniosporium tulheliwenetii]|uniref:Uncharacterized protein n=1 Tax=Coniosporium tulheliwenetii TaxID=3383036 RepID=A0ACC2YYF0_9PEZI|nr:hypothetical protein H2199_006000 [Cladosporium sp. JES 115]